MSGHLNTTDYGETRTAAVYYSKWHIDSTALAVSSKAQLA